jgi:hypothetical protein
MWRIRRGDGLLVNAKWNESFMDSSRTSGRAGGDGWSSLAQDKQGGVQGRVGPGHSREGWARVDPTMSDDEHLPSTRAKSQDGKMNKTAAKTLPVLWSLPKVRE